MFPVPHAVKVEEERAIGAVKMFFPEGGGPQKVAVVVVKEHQTHPLVPVGRFCRRQQGQHAGITGIGAGPAGGAVGPRPQRRHRQNEKQRQHQLRLVQGEADRQGGQKGQGSQRQRRRQVVEHVGRHVGGGDEVGEEGAGGGVVVGAEEDPRPLKEEIDFILDRPFLFVLTNRDGLPLFMGVVNAPG